MNKHLSRLLLWFTALLVSVAIIGCATGPALVDHVFEFDAINDSPDVEILDYRYGNSDLTGTRAPQWALKTGRIGQSMGIRGFIPIGESLYVKWKIRETGQVYEDTVDLRERLPKNIKDHRIHFSAQGAQLYVYVVSPEGVKHPSRWPPGPLRKYADLKVVMIYPIQKNY